MNVLHRSVEITPRKQTFGQYRVTHRGHSFVPGPMSQDPEVGKICGENWYFQFAQWR